MMESAMEDSEFTIYADHPSMNFAPSKLLEESTGHTPLQNSNTSKIQSLKLGTTKNYEFPVRTETYSANINSESGGEFGIGYVTPNPHKRVCDVLHYNDRPDMATNISVAKRAKKPESKWPEHLQKTFEDAVKLIPKLSIRNMKICGSSYGRNQYISFYIKDRTGVTRTSKQISSHIQALTTSKKNPDLANLLRNGPGESSEISSRFESVFTAILNRLPPKPEQTVDDKSNISFGQAEKVGNRYSQDSQESVPVRSFKNLIRILFKKFEMSYINFEAIKQSHMFSTLDHSFINSELPETTVSKSSLLQNFPVISNLIHRGLSVYDHDMVSKIPIIYGNVAITLPPLTNDLSAGCYNLTTKVGLSCLPREEKVYGIITLITSNNFKIQEIFEALDSASNKSKNEAVFTVRIGDDYWKNYVLNKQKEMNYNGTNNIRAKEETFSMEINSIKIQQFIVHYDRQTLSSNHGVLSLDQIEPIDVRCIIIWRFEKVLDQSKAVTSLKRISSIFDDTLSSSTPIKDSNSGNMILTHSRKNSTPSKYSHFFSPLRVSKFPLSLVANRQHINSVHKQDSIVSSSDGDNHIPPHRRVFHRPVLDYSNISSNVSNGQTNPSIETATHVIPPSSFSSHIAALYQTMPSDTSNMNLMDAIPVQMGQTNGPRTMDTFDYSTTNLSGRPDTSDIAETFTSNILDNTADTSFSTIEEVESETEQDNTAEQSSQMPGNKNSTINFTQVLASNKDVPATSIYNAERISNNPVVDMQFKIPFSEPDESIMFDKFNHLGNNDSGFDPLLMEYNNLMFGDSSTNPTSR
ncbi:hypothetical protein PMKS-003635 [Pichia membranifaciens]|uniref:TEA domain-containing protein n=1 Tax=Pichia membranifaciens TaxID=4926 RepID=A0A1Q2YKQ8_9ASCO|nr:hypothetical protein PMKS-003635 [Pichia membranifaciens]